jgi:hypothetical protein
VPRSLSSPPREASAQAMTGPAAPLERLPQTARREIDRHVNVNGRCGVCAVVFPCERAVLAEMVLGSF